MITFKNVAKVLKFYFGSALSYLFPRCPRQRGTGFRAVQHSAEPAKR